MAPLPDPCSITPLTSSYCSVHYPPRRPILPLATCPSPCPLAPYMSCSSPHCPAHRLPNHPLHITGHSELTQVCSSHLQATFTPPRAASILHTPSLVSSLLSSPMNPPACLGFPAQGRPHGSVHPVSTPWCLRFPILPCRALDPALSPGLGTHSLFPLASPSCACCMAVLKLLFLS